MSVVIGTNTFQIPPYLTEGDGVNLRQDGTTRALTISTTNANNAPTLDGYFGATGDGATDDAAFLTLAEASDFDYIDLNGKTYYTTRNIFSSPLTKNYYGEGNLIVIGVESNQFYYPKVAPIRITDVQRLSTKCPVLDWEGVNILWLGTSIPQEGSPNGYPELFAAAMGATVVNMAWAGSNANYDVDGDENDINTVKCLSMSEDHRAAGEALYGGSSAYAPGFDLVTAAAQMTKDYRIRDQFAAVPFSVVMLDHNHNDRKKALGTLSPPSVAISGVTKGATTTITLASAGTFAVGDDVALEVTGIASLNHWSGRVQTVSGSDITINLNSAGYAGTFTSGTAYKLDISTVYGAFDDLIHYIQWCAYNNGVDDVQIILSSAPSQFTGNTFDPYIRPNGEAIYAISQKWNIAYFDVCQEFGVTADQHLTYFPDGVHPTTLAARQALTNQWTRWASGGASKTVNSSDFLPAGVDTAYDDQREALYSRYARGFATPPIIIGSYTSVLSDDFSGGIGTWTAVGDTPTFVTAPWDAGESAMFCEHGGTATDTYIQKTGLTFDKSWSVAFDLWLPEVSGLAAASTTKTVAICHIRTSGNQNYYVIQLIVKETTVRPRVVYFTSPNVGLTVIECDEVNLSADTQHSIKLETYRADTGYDGGVLFTVDGTVISAVTAVDDSAHSNPEVIRLGIVDSNTDLPFDAYFGNLVVQKAAVSAFTSRFTGSFPDNTGATVTVVNGIITGVA